MIPKYYEIIHPLLKLIAKETQTRKGATEKLLLTFKLSEEDKQAKIASGVYTFENRVGWAFTYLTKAEYIELTEQKAVYRITNLGIDALKLVEERKIIMGLLNSLTFTSKFVVIFFFSSSCMSLYTASPKKKMPKIFL